MCATALQFSCVGLHIAAGLCGGALMIFDAQRIQTSLFIVYDMVVCHRHYVLAPTDELKKKKKFRNYGLTTLGLGREKKEKNEKNLMEESHRRAQDESDSDEFEDEQEEDPLLEAKIGQANGVRNDSHETVDGDKVDQEDAVDGDKVRQAILEDGDKPFETLETVCNLARAALAVTKVCRLVQ
eukprot:s290_g11.t1